MARPPVEATNATPRSTHTSRADPPPTRMMLSSGTVKRNPSGTVADSGSSHGVSGGFTTVTSTVPSRPSGTRTRSRSVVSTRTSVAGTPSKSTWTGAGSTSGAAHAAPRPGAKPLPNRSTHVPPLIGAVFGTSDTTPNDSW